MDRRGFVIGLGMCGLLSVPLACGPKKPVQQPVEVPPENGIPGEQKKDAPAKEEAKPKDEAK